MLATGAERIEDVLWTPIAGGRLTTLRCPSPADRVHIARAMSVAPTLRTPAALRGSRADRRRASGGALQRVAARYADRRHAGERRLDRSRRSSTTPSRASSFLMRSRARTFAWGGGLIRWAISSHSPAEGDRASLSRSRAFDAHPHLRHLLSLLLPARAGGPRGRERCRPTALQQGARLTSQQPLTLWEIILTGGDPLILAPRRLGVGDGVLERDTAREDRAFAHPRSRCGAGNDQPPP